MPKGSHRDKRLTAATVRSLTAPGFYPDGQGLYLKIDSGGPSAGYSASSSKENAGTSVWVRHPSKALQTPAKKH
jgi:hypothetical protein